jgi:hypothetical protein
MNKNYTISELNEIGGKAFDILGKNWNTLPIERRNQLSTAHELATNLSDAIQRGQSRVEYFTERLQRASETLASKGEMGNSLGILGGINEIEVINGQITAMQKVAPYIFRDAGLIETN